MLALLDKNWIFGFFCLTWWVTALVGCHREFCWVLKHFWSWNWYRRWQKEELQVIFCQNDWFFYQINQHMMTDFVWSRDLSILGVTVCQKVGVTEVLTFNNYNFNQLQNSSEISTDKLVWNWLKYFRVTSSSPSHLEAHAGFFRLSMKGKFDVYLLWPFGKMLISIS